MGESASDIKALVVAATDAARGFRNLHGVTPANLRSFVVDEPFKVTVDPDDLESAPRSMWVVLRFGSDLQDARFVVYDSASRGWAVAEQTPEGRSVAKVWGDSLSDVLDSM